VFDRILKTMRELVRTRQYVMTIHADEEMFEDGLRIRDIENVFLTGKIVERQRDRHTGEWKYLVAGRSLAGSGVVAVAQIGFSRKLVIITVYAND
jgi:uncharacterized DUF497 family protein